MEMSYQEKKFANVFGQNLHFISCIMPMKPESPLFSHG